MQPLTPAPLLNNKGGDLISQKRAARMSSTSPSPSHQQYNQHQTKVKSMLEQFDLMHQPQNNDSDDDNEEDPFGASSTMGILPISKSFEPPQTMSVGTQQKIGAEQQQIKASHMQNSQMGYSLSLPPTQQQQQQQSMPTSTTLAGSAYSLSDVDTTPLVAGTPKEGFNGLASWTDNQYGKYLGAATLAQSPTTKEGNMDVELYRLGGTTTPTWAQKGGLTAPVWKPTAPINMSDDLLMTKLNYMINLLEEQKDEKTGNITEEIVLYSFLGVFMIFIVDSFSRVGKYVR